MIRHPVVGKGKTPRTSEPKPESTVAKAYTSREKRTIAFQHTVSVTGAAVSTQDCSVETESSWASSSSEAVATFQEAAVQTCASPCATCLELYSKLLQKSEKIVSLELSLSQAFGTINENTAFSASLQFEIERLKAALQRLEVRKETVRQTCVSHLDRVEDQLGLLERNRAALEEAAAARQGNCYEGLIEALKRHNSSLILQAKEAEIGNETLKTEIIMLKSDLQDVKTETRRLNSVKIEAISMLSEQETLEKRLFTMQSTVDQRKSQVKDLIRQMHLKDVTIKDLQSSNSALQARIQLFQRLSHT